LKHLAPKGLPLAQFALRWLLDHPAVSTIIAGVTKPSQLEANVAATKVDPIEPAVNEELKDWYDRKVRKEIRGRI
jgi:aryl-alcohol dehydrogenase-like predicted oxidoreductase